LIAIVFVACSKASDNARQMPKLPPPPHAAPPAALRIAVEIDGNEAPPIDAARLAALKPEFEDADHRAWRLATLIGSAAQTHAVIAVTGENDVTVQFRRPASERDPQPVLALTRRGELVAALVEPGDPFPAYHGQGRRLRRPGDPLPRIAGVKKIRVSDEK
jgi:hypothetical protein